MINPFMKTYVYIKIHRSVNERLQEYLTYLRRN